MNFDWTMILVIWFVVGIISSMLVYWDMGRRKKIQWIWALLCIPLSVLGIFIYLAVRENLISTGRELPPKPDYGKPEYVFKDEPIAEKVPEPTNDEKTAPPEPETRPVKVEEKEEVLPEPPPVQPKVDLIEERPAKKERIEGIPRCPKCNAAVSSFDESCRDCGAKLK